MEGEELKRHNFPHTHLVKQIIEMNENFFYRFRTLRDTNETVIKDQEYQKQRWES